MKLSVGIFAVAALAAAIQAQAQSANALEEIVVTAQKRAQSTQDVAIAVSAFNADQIRNLGSSGLQELAQHVAGAELFDDRGSGQPTWVIRGVGLADFNPNNTPTAAVYYDDFYLFSNVLGGVGLFDVDQVEILKGPQSGLYGRNTSGGAVRVTSRPAEVGGPSNGYVKASYGRWGKSKLEAAAGGELSDTAAYRLALLSNQGGGWQDSLTTPGNDRHGEQDYQAVRAQLMFEPNDALSVMVKLDAGKDNSETTLGLGRANLNQDGSDFCASALSGSMSDMGCYTSANLYSQYVLEQGFGSLASEQDDSGKRSNSSPINKLDNEWLGGNVRFEWDADDFQLTSITAVLSYNFGQVYDFDASPLSLFTETSQTKMDAWSQEFRFQGELGDSTYWLAGLSYADETIDALRNSDLSQYQDFPSIGHRAFEQVTQSWAAYAQVEYQLSDHWRFNSSIRFTDEDKSLNNYRFFESEGAGIDFNESGDIAPFYWLSGVNKNYELGSQWSGHIGIDWTPTEDILVYGKVTRGFKSGGFFGGFAFAEDELTPYEEELVTSYEIGLKSELFDNSLRFNAAAFYYNYEDVQGFTQVFNSSTNSILTKLGNLGDAEHQGIELEMVWLPESLPGLQLSAQYAYLDAEISDSDTIALDPAGIPGPLEGTRRSSAPKNSAGLQLSYQLDLSDSVILDVAANYSWRSDVNPRSVYNTDLDYSLFGIESYQVMGLRLGLALEDHWQLALLGDNLSNETYVVSTSSDDLGSYNKIPGRPRSWTLEVSYNW